jgi:hypothetical protein
MAKAGLGVILQHRTVLSTKGESCESPFVSPHHIAGPHLNSYAGEASWREDHRRASNGRQAGMVGFAAMGTVSAANGLGIGRGQHNMQSPSFERIRRTEHG